MKNLSILVALVIIAAFHAVARVELRDTLVNSEIYPHTCHSYVVSLPDNPQGEMALYLGLDGELCGASAVLDSLSGQGLVPPVVCVFLQPGLIYDRAGKVIRYDRCNEFDSTDDRFSMFLEQELLPAVDSIIALRYCDVRVTKNPARRMIFGLSSGGIAAFTAAWHRPDLFGLVFSGCGTFVPMRGGDNWPGIVRKHEPKQLRIFLQDGYDDTWNPLFGSWYEYNRLLASALEFSGYDCAFDWAEGGHSVRRATEIFPDVMKWLWRNDSIEYGKTGNNFISPLVSGHSCLWEESQDCIRENLAGHFDEGRIVEPYPGGAFVAVVDSTRRGNYVCQKIDSVCEPFYYLHSYGSSLVEIYDMRFDGLGNLWVATSAGIQVCDQNGRVRAIFGYPVVLNKGEIPAIRILDGVLELTVSYPDGRTTGFRRRLNIKQPSGIPESQGQG